MLREVVETLKPIDGGVYVDGTFGGGGYTKAILEAAQCTVIAIDQDPDAIARGQSLQKQYGDRLRLVHGNFGDVATHVAGLGYKTINGIVLDLGVSSYQLDEAERGFSFMRDGPLDMRMGRQGPSAADLLAALDEKELADIFYLYGEERHSRKIARHLVSRRKVLPFTRTLDLAEAVADAKPGPRGKIHPATQVFQALRIAVNSELDVLQKALSEGAEALGAEGRYVVVSFHSLEDRIVKTTFKDMAGPRRRVNRYKQDGEAVTSGFDLPLRKALECSAEEARINPRSRSAKLRVLERLA
ncbi:MAG: 16S rRNA (cytosine(1402)-N(4))-methyltransferase RsmH [Proteobacteria bacterium]|nr:16S rRNA (cytosine(1402)-N(4))-methyltransferase RsmH [Pseudomonadota bacterium]